MSTKPNLRRYLVEATVIVGSILLAFAIDAAWQSRQDNFREKQLLASILSDMENNSIELTRIIENNLIQDRAVQRFLSATSESLEHLTDRESARNLLELESFPPLSALLGSNSFTPFLGSLSESNLAEIQDLEIRSELGSWLGLSADVVEATPRAYTESEKVKHQAAGHGAAVPASEMRGLLPEVLPEGIPTFGDILSAMRGDEDFINSFLVYHNQRKNTFRKLGPLSESTEKLISMLQGNN